MTNKYACMQCPLFIIFPSFFLKCTLILQNSKYIFQRFQNEYYSSNLQFQRLFNCWDIKCEFVTVHHTMINVIYMAKLADLIRKIIYMWVLTRKHEKVFWGTAGNICQKFTEWSWPLHWLYWIFIRQLIVFVVYNDATNMCKLDCGLLA